MPDTHTHEPPQWINNYVQFLVEAFGLENWEVTVKMERTIGEDDRLGEAAVQSRYMTADIQLRDTLEEDREGIETVVHEMLHLTQAPQDLAVDRIIDMVPKKLRNHARELYADGNEMTTTNLSRALAKVLKPAAASTDTE